MRLMRTVGLLCAGMSSLAGAQVFYDATTPRVVAGSSPPRDYYYNPGSGSTGHILLDDVTVQTPRSLPNPLFNVKRITFGISRKANAGAVQITPYYAALVPDNQEDGGPGDAYFPDVTSPTQLASPISLGVNGSTIVQSVELSFGDGVHTLFNIAGAPASLETAYRSFAVGLQFSTSNSDNGWTVATNAHNIDNVWDYVSNTNFSEFTYGSDSAGLIIGTQYVRVEGLVLSGVPGDADSDGDVDINDLGLLASHWQTNADFAGGDFDFNGFVDISDLGILASHWQTGVNGPLSAALASFGLPDVSVPEPTLLAPLLAAGLLGRFRRRERFMASSVAR